VATFNPRGYRKQSWPLQILEINSIARITKLSDEDAPRISVVILNFNGMRHLKRCLESVLNTEYPNFEVIFVDNASVDGSLNLVKRNFGGKQNIRIVQNEKNYGFAEGNNIGAKKADGHYLVFLNNDTEVKVNWLKELVKASGPPGIGVVQSMSLWIRDRRTIDSFGGFIDAFGYSHNLADFASRSNEIFYAEGLCLFISKELFDKIGGFDGDYFFFEEDVDLCWRVHLQGLKVVVAPESIVYHARGGTAPGKLMKLEPNWARLTARNRLITLVKNYGLVNAFRYVPPTILLEIGKAFWLILIRKPRIGLATLQGILEVLVHLRHIWAKRVVVQSHVRRVSDSAVMKIVIPAKESVHRLLGYSTLLRKEAD